MEPLIKKKRLVVVYGGFAQFCVHYPPKPPKGQLKGKGKGGGSKGKGTPNFAGDKGFKRKGKGKGRGEFSFDSFSSPKNGLGGKSKGKGKMTNKGTFPGGKGSTKGWQAGYNSRRWQ